MGPYRAMNGLSARWLERTPRGKLEKSQRGSDSMTTQATSTRLLVARDEHPGASGLHTNVAPIVAAIDGSSASSAAVEASVRLARELDAPIVFVYVRRGPAAFLGSPEYQRRLTAKMGRARRVLDGALKAAADAGVNAEAEILEGSPRRRIAEFAGVRRAQLVVVGSRRYRLGRSVSCGLVRAAGRPVVVAQGLARLVSTGRAA
jgi:nucleotide-binding universal stress UspA family protein